MPPVPSSMKDAPRLGKKVGIMQKPKGAVRAKSGCYTCRIRRKVRPPVFFMLRC
ncbi:hypothetical protein HYPSUDRAFT_49265 [Hypholoma sublateritium FD-334 SS-4]|uniref:Uncharacterized protein n=1 Tax=Hypholoma sublateritium (strain FD-334 SS-4) TaxID=945553 RepID=A0A0D2KIC1_HYPSF|nr:hypothetical protein HYPSUDRAFT_49265 [Hypholoma sublateritium FD-334 SS-4]